MKSILSILLAALMLFSVMSGCARDMTGETRATPVPGNATERPRATAKPAASAKPTDSAVPSARPTDSTADGVIDEGKDAVDGIVGAGEDAVNDVVGAGEDVVNDVVGAGEDIIDDVTGNDRGDGRNDTQSAAGPEATPNATAKN